MENKKTTELLDLLGKNKGDAYDSELEDTVLAELRQRAPFFELLNEDWNTSLTAV